MGRTAGVSSEGKQYRIENLTQRDRCPLRPRPYYCTIDYTLKLTLGYIVKRPAAGQWHARRQTGRTKTASGHSYPVYETWAIGQADDSGCPDADGVTIFSFDHAKMAAIAEARQRVQAGGYTKTARTVRDMVEHYARDFQIRGSLDWGRVQIALDKHLLPRFGDRLLMELTRADGERYLSERQKAGASNGTIKREYGILMRLLNLASKHDFIPKNKLKRDAKELPVGAKRSRVADDDEVRRLILGTAAIPKTTEETLTTLRRAAIVALHTGLREGKILSISRDWIDKRPDGYWLTIPAPTSVLKGTPAIMPLTRQAYAALISAASTPITGPCIPMAPKTFAVNWPRVCARAKISGLTFHDLRHTFTTRLEELEVSYDIRQLLLGHAMPGKTKDYSHGKLSDGVRRQMREAVTKLEQHWAQVAQPPRTRPEPLRSRKAVHHAIA